MKEKLRFFPSDTSALKIPLIGITLPNPKYYIVRQNSAITVVEYVRSGTGYIIIDGKPTEVSAGKVYLLCAGENQEYYSSEDDPWEKVFINTTGPLAQIIPHTFRLKGFNIFDGDGLEDIFKQVEQIVEKTPEADDCKNVAVLFFEAIYMLAEKHRNIKHSDEAVRLKSYIDENIQRIVKNDELARLIFRSCDYCIKLFTAEYGITPYEYQLKCKIEHTCMLLDNTSMSIADIGAAVGYTDPQYFSGLFKKRVGMPPSAYRKRAK